MIEVRTDNAFLFLCPPCTIAEYLVPLESWQTVTFAIDVITDSSVVAVTLLGAVDVEGSSRTRVGAHFTLQQTFTRCYSTTNLQHSCVHVLCRWIVHFILQNQNTLL